MDAMCVYYYSKKERAKFEESLQLFRQTPRFIKGSINKKYQDLCGKYNSSISLFKKIYRTTMVKLHYSDSLISVKSIGMAKHIFKPTDQNGKIRSKSGNRYVLSLPKNAKF